MVTKKRPRKLFHYLIPLLLLLIFYYFSETQAPLEPISSELPVLYSNVCHDNLETLCVDMVQEAKKSILLIIYSLSDEKLIKMLNARAEQGCQVKVLFDRTTPDFGFQKLSKKIETQGIKMPGLMHKKIFVIDHEKVLIGSANMTTESLKVHDNLVIGLINSQLAQAIIHQEPYCLTQCGEQTVEYWNFPKSGKEGLKNMIELIDRAKESIRIAMFTWTHPQLTQAVIRAHRRGAHVEIILDHGQANGVSQASYQALVNAGLSVRLSTGLGLLHHKFAWIDESYLLNGSANWTAAAFTRNQDCLLILYPLTKAQNEKLHTLWKKTRCSRECDLAFELIAA